MGDLFTGVLNFIIMNVISSNGTFVGHGGASNASANNALLHAGCWGTLTGISGVSAIAHLLAGNGINTIWYLALALLAGSHTHSSLKRSNPLEAVTNKTINVSSVPA